MQKTKWIIMSVAIVMGIGGAIITRPNRIVQNPERPFLAANDCLSSTAIAP